MQERLLKAVSSCAGLLHFASQVTRNVKKLYSAELLVRAHVTLCKCEVFLKACLAQQHLFLEGVPAQHTQHSKWTLLDTPGVVTGLNTIRSRWR